LDGARFRPFVDGYYDVENQLPEYIRRLAEGMFKAEAERKSEAFRSKEAFMEYRSRARELFEEAIGGLPGERCPLNPESRGILEKKDYRIEKIIYQSMPGFYVTALLYIPKGFCRPMPAVLFLSGHTEEAKASPIYQRACISLARNGFVVLAIDPPGQGELLQYWDREAGKSPVGWGTNEHSYEGLQCILTGSNIARYFVWNAIRGLDYLCTRSEVDPERLAATGNSGGGTQTSYLMLLEDRLAAAAPCCYITSRDAYIKTGQPHDAEQNIYGAIRNGINYDDFICLFAPKPAMIGAAAYDFFCIEGTLQSYARAKAAYGLFNSEENVAITIGKHTHGLRDPIRRAVVRWFSKHLRGEEPKFPDGEIEPEEPKALNVTRSGQILGEKPEAKTIFRLNNEYLRSVRPRRTRIEDEESLSRHVSSVRKRLRGLLAFEPGREEIRPRVIHHAEADGLTYEKIFFFSEPGIVLTSVMLYKSGLEGKAPAVLVLLEEGTNGIPQEESLIRSLAEDGRRVLLLDVRGTGGVRTRAINSRFYNSLHGTFFKLCYDSFMLGTSLLAMRVYDVTRGLDYLTSRGDIDPTNVSLYARRKMAIYGYLASVLDERVRAVQLEDMLISYENLVSTRLYSRVWNEEIAVHGFLGAFDLVDLLPALHGREYRLVNPRDGEGKVASRRCVEEYWTSIVERYYPLLGDVEERIEWKSPAARFDLGL
jgi:cephalosporin-C deacetylase-like acetyl esterase